MFTINKINIIAQTVSECLWRTKYSDSRILKGKNLKMFLKYNILKEHVMTIYFFRVRKCKVLLSFKELQPGLIALACMPAFRRLRQEDHQEFKASRAIQWVQAQLPYSQNIYIYLSILYTYILYLYKYVSIDYIYILYKGYIDFM